MLHFADEETGTEQLNNLSIVKQLVGDKTKTQTEVCCFSR